MRILVVPVLLGVVSVLQAGLNRKIAVGQGLLEAVFINATILFSLALGSFILFERKLPAVQNFSWWYCLPGIFGFLLVSGGPWSVARLGASTTFVLLISTQIVMSLVWDLMVEEVSWNSWKISGIIIVWLGALMNAWGSR